MRKLIVGTFVLLFTLVFICSITSAALPTAPDVIHSGTTQWFDAARTGRADMLILGDSVVYSGGHGWDAGFNVALANRVGLAASGLMKFVGSSGDGFGAFTWGDGFTFSPSAVRLDRHGYFWDGDAMTGDASMTGTYNYSAAATPLVTSTGYDLHLYTAPTGTTGTLEYSSRLGAAPFNTLIPVTQQQVTLPAQGLREVQLHVDRPAGFPNHPVEISVKPIDLSIFYGRMSVPGAKGASVTSWGYGGHSTKDFYLDLWTGQGVTPEGRKTWFDAMTQGGSGKLNVLITEGFNDRNLTTPSLKGTLPGNSPQAFADNITSLIDQVRADWLAAGRASQDLSFTLLGMYEDQAEYQQYTLHDRHQLHDYAFALQQIATDDAQISFINLQNHVGPFPTISAAGWLLQDGIHPTRQGILAMSQIVVDALVPEPGALALLVFGLLGLTRRRAA